MAIYYGRNGTEYELIEKKRKKAGGEGATYEVQGRPDLLAKLYNPDQIDESHEVRERQEKLLAMLDMGFDCRYEDGKLLAAWPSDILYDDSGKIRGYVMPLAKNMKSLIWAIRQDDRDILFFDKYRWRKSVAMAHNLCLAVELMHSRGVVIGDMNTNNILVNAEGDVTLIDTDSFDFSWNGRHFKCRVGFPEVLPPELQGRDLSDPSIEFSEQTDCFSLAVHVFTLLCNNCHPFGCLNITEVHGSSSRPDQEGNILRGYCPYVTGAKGETALDALDMRVFPKEIRDLFDRAFTYTAETAMKAETIARRPSAAEWREALGRMYQAGFQTCRENTQHEYPAGYTHGCPWCAIEKRRPKPPAPPSPPPPPPPPPPRREIHWGWIIALLLLLAVMVYYVIRQSGPSATQRKWAEAIGISRVEQKMSGSYYLYSGDAVGRFTFTAPSAGDYVFTTLNSGDTYGILNESVSDDDSGEGQNFLIRRWLAEGEQATVDFGFYDPEESGNIHYYVLRVERD